MSEKLRICLAQLSFVLLFFAADDHLADGIALGGEFLLVLGHHIALTHGIVMQVSGIGQDLPAAFLRGLQRKGKQILVVCLKLYHTIGL